MLCATHDRSPATTCPTDCLPPLCPLTSSCSITRYQWAVFVFTLSQLQLQTPTCLRENKQTFKGVTEVLEVTLTVSVQVYKCKEMSAKGSLTKSLVLTVITSVSRLRNGTAMGKRKLLISSLSLTCLQLQGGEGAGRSRHDTPRLAVCHLKFSISSLLQESSRTRDVREVRSLMTSKKTLQGVNSLKLKRCHQTELKVLVALCVSVNPTISQWQHSTSKQHELGVEPTLKEKITPNIDKAPRCMAVRPLVMLTALCYYR
ncbi:Protein SENSITIVE TO PROTON RHIZOTOXICITY 1, partial [Dissostichus eleginoides]